LLRTHGKSYVCDVNGFSFVKTSKKYYDDAAQVLMSLIVQELAPQLYKPYNLDVQEEIPTVEALEGTMLELRCVIGIIRHGDRTPKQKMKMEVRHPRWETVTFFIILLVGLMVIASSSCSKFSNCKSHFSP